MKIFLNDIQLHAKHGVLPQERLVGNDYLITVEADAHVEKAGETDDLGDTVNYADMADAIRQEMAQPSQLLEHVATRIAKRLLRDYATLSSVRVRITKLSPPIPRLQCSGAGVEITLQH